MGKNMSAKECGDCGNLIYYGGRCNCLEPIREPTDLELARWQEKDDDDFEHKCQCMDCVCPTCGNDWPKSSKWELCKASKLYKGKAYLIRDCSLCDEVVEVFWRSNK